MRFLLSFATALAATAVAVPGTRAPHEKRETLPAPWKLARRARAEQVVPVRIGMKQRNLEEGARILEEISDQNSPNYGQWWSVEDVHDFFAPATAHVESVKEWLNTSRIHHNRTSLSANKQWVQFDATIGELEDLLNTQYHRISIMSSTTSRLELTLAKESDFRSKLSLCLLYAPKDQTA
ncbi:hypothetical protein PRZ48_004090 [Zasmidium cellare]|uniref:Peptidase S53 activation domain-containing protein n=1 Tax=Zasmidium cellare TaxID=395010 RepID=A0ABR0EY49_ZASCE|nr:hypothetical protein PRZ48_004090 [Zasmidium cellare]